MAKVARVTDPTSGYCSAHEIGVSGQVITGSDKTFANGLKVARIGDTVQASCGHTGAINSGSSKMKADSIGVSRIGDSFSGVYSGTITGGSPDVNTE